MLHYNSIGKKVSLFVVSYDDKKKTLFKEG